MRPEVFHVPFTNFPIDRVHSGRVDADENFTRLWLRTRRIFGTARLPVRRSCEFELLSLFGILRSNPFRDYPPCV